MHHPLGRDPVAHDDDRQTCGILCRRAVGTGGSSPESSLGQGSEPTGPLAQLAEQRTFNPRVVGSSPTGPTNVFAARRCSHPDERRIAHRAWRWRTRASTSGLLEPYGSVVDPLTASPVGQGHGGEGYSPPAQLQPRAMFAAAML